MRIFANHDKTTNNRHALQKYHSLPTRNGVGPSLIALPSGQWKTILDFLVDRFANISPAEWHHRMRNGDVLNANGSVILPDTPYQADIKIYYYRNIPNEIPVPFTESVIYQDEWLVVADKPHFLPVTPSGRYLQETLLVRLKKKLNLDTLTPIHRIDRETAGIVVFAVQPHTRALYQNLFKDKSVKKHYEAIAPLHPELSFPMTYSSKLVEGDSFMRMKEIPGKSNAQTIIELLETKENFAHYALTPITGKKHQLRVQMAALGIPIVNDQIYPYHYPEALDEDAIQLSYKKPLKLLSKSISFTDPVSGVLRQFESLKNLGF